MHCEWFLNSHCHSCELLDTPYPETLKQKESALIGVIPEVQSVLQASVGLTQTAGSRSKAKLAVFRLNSKIHFGFTNEQGISKILETCPLHRPDLNLLLPDLRELLERFKIEPYDLQSKRGELKYLILSQSHSHDDVLLRFTLRSKESLDRLRKLSTILINTYPKIKTVTANIQPHHQAIFEGEEEILLTNQKFIKHRFGDVTVYLGPRSFFQVSPEMAEKLYTAVGEFIQNKKMKSLLDLYCGVGAFSYFAARSAVRVQGIEISPEAIGWALEAAVENEVAGTIDFQAMDAEKYLQQNREKFEAVLVNPPRRGLNPAIISSILSMNPQWLLYSSCNYETLSRDHQLISSCYKIESAQIFDMFPFTSHFETLMLYSRK